MERKLNGRKVAILVADGFEQSEMVEPRKALDDAGATTHLISPTSGAVRGWKDGNWADSFEVDQPLKSSDPDVYDALLLPGGVLNPDQLRTNENVLTFVRSFFEAGKPVAAICHGPWTLINADVVKGRTMTSYHTIRRDLENAGAKWVDQEVVVDEGLVTSRSPSDLPAFNRKLVEEVGEGRHAGQMASV